MMDLNIACSLVFTIIVATMVLSGTIKAVFSKPNANPQQAATGPAIKDFSRGRVVQVGNGEKLFRLTHLYNKAKGLIQFAEVVPIDKLGQPIGKATLRQGDFEDLIDEVAGIPEGSLAHGHTPEFPDPAKPRGKRQASKRQRYLPAPLRSLPAPTSLH
jgi:hypothetical protein